MKIYSRLLLLGLFLTFLMITLGGIVHNTGSSLACPDWPLCRGQFFPRMVGSVAIEHSHRLLGALIGLLTIALLILSFNLRLKDSSLFKWNSLALILVILQGTLGGLTVLLKLSAWVSTFHLVLSQIYMGTLLWLFIRSQKILKPTMGSSGLEVPSKPRKWLLIALSFVFFQMILGAALRHTGSGIACGLGPNAMFLCQEGFQGSPQFWPHSSPAQFHMLHRYLALLTFALVIGGSLPFLKWVKKTVPQKKKLRLLVVAAHILVSAQILWGFLSLYLSLSLIPLTLHLVTASLLCFVLLSLNFLAAGKIST